MLDVAIVGGLALLFLGRSLQVETWGERGAGMRGVLPCWPANRSARPRSTSRFAGGRAFPGCRPSRVCIRSTSSQLPPGFQAGAFAGLTGAAAPFRRTVFQMRFAFLAEAPASTGSADVPCGRSAWPVTVHALARYCTGKLESKGFSYGRRFAPPAGLPRTCVRVGIGDSAPRRGGGQAARHEMATLLGFRVPSRV